MKTIESLAYLCTRIVASVDDDPYGISGDILLPWRSADDLKELHRELHVLRRCMKPSTDIDMSLKAVCTRHIEKIVTMCNGDYAKSARILGVNVSTIYRYRMSGRVLGHHMKGVNDDDS